MSKQMEFIGYQQEAKINVFVNRIWYRMPHFHNAFEISIALEGNSTWIISGERIEVQAGDMILVNPKELHEITSDDKACLHLYMQFPTSFFQTSFSPLENLHFQTHILRPDASDDKKDLYSLAYFFALHYLQAKEEEHLLSSSIFHLFMAKLLDTVAHHTLAQDELLRKNNDNERMSRLLEFIQKNYQMPIRLQDFASQEGLSLSYTSRFVKEQVQKNFQDLVKEFRLLRAQELLSNTKLSNTELAYQAGFSDPRYMQKAFEEKYQMNPREYQEALSKTKRRVFMDKEDTYSIEQMLDEEKSVLSLKKFSQSNEKNLELVKQLLFK